MDTKLLFLVFVNLWCVHTKLQGTVQYQGRTCTWVEQYSMLESQEPLTSKTRYLAINCRKEGNLPQYYCQYTGNPHPCRWYNKNQREYYQCLADRLAMDNTSICNPNEVVCQKQCDEIVFRKYQASTETGSLLFKASSKSNNLE